MHDHYLKALVDRGFGIPGQVRGLEYVILRCVAAKVGEVAMNVMIKLDLLQS